MAGSGIRRTIGAVGVLGLVAVSAAAWATRASGQQEARPQAKSSQSIASPQQKQAAIFIKGTVRDESGATVPNATVMLEEKENGSAEAKTGQDGTFSFLSLRAGTFRIRVTAQGFKQIVTEPMALAQGQTKQIDVVLHVGTCSGPIVQAPPSPAQPSASALQGIEFSDEPKFTVAGVTDWSNAGLHGSDVQATTSDSLNKEALALKSGAAGTGETSHSARSGEAHRLAGDEYEQKGDALAAEREYETAVRLDASEANYFAWGTDLLVHKAIQPAIEIYGKGAAAYPRSARMLIGLGAALYAALSYEEAERRVCQAADLNPADTAPYSFLGKIAGGLTSTAPCVRQALERFANQHPESAQANYFYALALWKSQRMGIEPAERDSPCTIVDPSHPDCAPNMVLTDTARWHEEESLLRKAVAAEPKFADAQLQLAKVFFSENRFTDAIAAGEKAIAADPQLIEAHYQMGLAYKRNGEQAKAQQEFEQYRKLQKNQEADLEKQKKQMQQFVVILKSDKKE